MYLLDTNTCIQFLNGKSLHVANRLRAHSPSKLKLCSVVKAEMLYGAARSLHPERTRLLMEGFFSHYESFPFDDAAAAFYGSVRQSLAVVDLGGKSTLAFDLLADLFDALSQSLIFDVEFVHTQTPFVSLLECIFDLFLANSIGWDVHAARRPR